MKVAYIDQYKETFGVQPICDALDGTDAEIASILNRIEDQPDVLAKWAEAPVGQALAGTGSVVTHGREE